MLRKLVAVLAISLAAFTAATSSASAASQPVGSYTVGLSGLCLTAQNGSDIAGTPVVLAHCHPNWHRDQWSFTNGQLSPWGTSTVVSVSPDGFLVLADSSSTGSTWTYGPNGHELTTLLPSGSAFLTWVAGHGRQPWADTMAGPGQTAYLFQLG